MDASQSINTGIALAFVCDAKGYRLTLATPESMPVERRKLHRGMAAGLELTPAGVGMPGAIRQAQELSSKEIMCSLGER